MSAPAVSELPQRLAALAAVAALRARLGDRDDVWLVGGAVRDLLLGATPLDFDLVVDGELDDVIERLGIPARSHDRFGTAAFLVDGVAHDVARARRERYRHPGALPEVEPAGLSEDLRRRDFTVNALAARLSDGELVTVPDALEDLAAGRLRVLHDDSFRDDPTRLLRLARYAGRLGFAAEAHTAQLAARALAEGALDTVSGNRIGAELILLAAEPDPAPGFAALRRLGIDDAIASGFGVGEGVEAERLRAAIELLGTDGDRIVVALAAALRSVPVAQRGPLLERLGLTAARRNAILAAANRCDTLTAALAAAERPSQIAAAVGRLPTEAVALAGAAHPAAAAAARAWLESLRHVSLEIDGSDLIAAGMQPGPELGAALARARAARLDGRATDRAQELAAALGGDGAAG